MGEKGQNTRNRFVRTAVELFRKQGYHATGLNEIVERSGAPKGSLYFHFKNKEELAATALEQAAWDRLQELEALAARPGLTVAERMSALVDALRDTLIATNFNDGCPISSVGLETAARNPNLQKAASASLSLWEEGLTRLLRDGVAGADGTCSGDTDAGRTNESEASATEVRARAIQALAAIEGALVLAKVHRSAEPLERIRPLLMKIATG